MTERQVNGNMTRNMDIDEAIAHERQKAKDNRNEFYTFGVQKCKQCAEEHEQLAEWLEQLKAYKQNTDICPICDTHCSYLVDEYNRGVDDLVKLVHEELFIYDTIDDLAEQLKAGGENDD